MLNTSVLLEESVTAQAYRGGWLHTGDVAVQDEDGYFYLLSFSLVSGAAGLSSPAAVQAGV